MPKNNQTIEIPTSNNLSKIVEEMVKLNDFTSRFAPLIVDYAKTIKAFGKIDAKEMRNNAHNIGNIAGSIDVFTKSVGVVMAGLKKLNDGIDIKDIEDLRKKLLTGESGGDVIVMRNIESKGNSSLDLTKEITKSKVSKPGLIDIVAQVATLSGTMQSLQFANPIKFKLKFLQTINLFKWQYSKLVEFSSAFDTKTIRTIKFATDGLQEVMMSIPSAVGAMTSMFSSYGESRTSKYINRGIKVLLGDNMDGTGGVVWSILLIGEQLNEKPLNQASIESFRDVMKSFSESVKGMADMLTSVALTWPLLKIGTFVLFGHGGKKPGLIDTILTNLDQVAENGKNIDTASKSISQMASSLLVIIGSISLISLAAPFVILSSVTVFTLSFVIKGLLRIYSMVANSESDISESSDILTQMASSLLVIVGSISLISLAFPFVTLSLVTIPVLYLVVKSLTSIYSMITDNSDDIITASDTIKQMASSLLILVGSVSIISLAAPLVVVSMITVFALSLVVKSLTSIYSMITDNSDDIITASDTIKQMASSLLILVGSVSIISLVTPMVVLSLITILTLSLVIKGLVRIYSTVAGHAKNIDMASRVFNQISTSLLLFVGSLVIIGLTFMIAAPLIAVAMVATLAIVGLMVLMSILSKNVKEGGKVLKDMALAMLILSATALLMAVTGQFIVANWESMLIVSAYLLVLVGSCLLLALAKKIINEGTRELLYLALAIVILAGTAMLMAVVGQFITANWENMLIMSAYLLVLVGSCLLLSLAKKWIESGAKELLFIALAVAILAGVAMLMIYVGGLLTVNWEPVLTVTLLLTVLVGATYLIARASKTIQKGWVAMLIVVLFAAAMASVVYILAEISNAADPLKLLEVVGIMALIMVAVGGIAVVAGILQEQIMQGAIAVAIISGISLVLSIVMKNLATAASIAPPLEILEVTGIMALIMVAVGAMTIASGMLLAGPQAIAFGLGMAAMSTLTVVALLLTEVVKNTAKAATAVKAAGLKDPDEVAAIISLPIKAFTKEDKDGKSLFGYIADLPNPANMASYVGKVTALTKITVSIGRIADILQHIASLNMPDPDKGYDEKGRPKGYKQMKSDDFMAVAQNTAVILGMTSAMFGEEQVDFELGDGAKFTVVPCDLAALDKISLKTTFKIRLLSRIVGHVSNMADTLQHIASLKMPDPDKGFTEEGRPKGYLLMKSEDFMSAAQNASAILSFFTGLFAEEATEVIFGGSKATVEPLNMAALDKISRSTRRKIERLGDIVAAVGGMAVSLQNISSLMIPDPDKGFTEDGKPKGFNVMSSDDFRNAAVNAGSILAFFANIFADSPTTMEFAGSQVTITPISMAVLDNLSRGTKKKVARLGEIVAVVGGMAETLKNMSSLIVPDAMNPEDFNENGTPKKWRKMATTDISNAALTAGSMLEFFCALFGEQSTTLSLGSLGGVTINPISESALDNISRGTKKKMERLGEIIAVVGGLGETLKNLSGLIVPDANGPEDFNENGTPKKWRKMTQQDFDQAMAVAEMMLTSVVNILGNEQMQNKLSSISKRNAKKLDIAMQAVNGLGNIMELVKALAGGRMATKWEKDNDPNSPTYGQQVAVEYINLTEYLDKNQDKITSTVYDLIMCPINAIASIVDNKSAMDSVEKANEYGSKITGVLINIKQPITDIIDLYNDKLSGVNVDSIRPAFEGVMLGVISPLADLDPDRVELVKKGSLVVFERIATSLTNASKIPNNSAKNFQNNVKETVGLLKTVDSVNLDKLKTASDLMKHIEGLSKSINGNFKELAHAINEDLLEALEKLTGALDDVNKKDFNVAVAGDVISQPSGSAGVNEKREPQPVNKNQLTKSDLDNVIRAINDLTSKVNKVISDGKVQVKMAP